LETVVASFGQLKKLGYFFHGNTGCEQCDQIVVLFKKAQHFAQK